MTTQELKKAIKFASMTLMGNLIVLGTSSNIFSAINNNFNSVDMISTAYGYRNKKILKKYLDTLVKYNILFEKDGEYFYKDSFSNKIDIEELKTTKVTEDFTTYSYALMKFFNHYLIDESHPHVTTSFINDPDIWNLWLGSKWHRLSIEVIANEINIQKGEAILDVGCGSHSPIFYGKLVGAHGRLLGIDKSEGLVNEANKCIKKLGYGWVSVKKCDVEQYFLFKEKYDVVIISDMLQYVKDIKKAIHNIDRAIKKNGRIIIFTTCFEDSPEEYVPIMEFINAHVKNYVQNFSRVKLENELKQLGYEIKEVSEKSMLLIGQKSNF